jgi:hypothetical protein
MQLIARGQDDGRQQEIEAQDEADEHAGEDGQDRLMDGLDLPRLQDVAREQGHDEQGDEDGQPP